MVSSEGRFKLVSPVQPCKPASPILVSKGKEHFVSPVQPCKAALPSSERAGRFSSASFLHPTNAFEPRVVSFDASIVVSAPQFSKAFSSMLSSSGQTTFVIPVHPLKAALLSAPSKGSCTSVRAVHPMNAFSEIVAIFAAFGMVASAVQPLKTDSAMEVTASESVTVVSAVHPAKLFLPKPFAVKAGSSTVASFVQPANAQSPTDSVLRSLTVVRACAPAKALSATASSFVAISTVVRLGAVKIGSLVVIYPSPTPSSTVNVVSLVSLALRDFHSLQFWNVPALRVSVVTSPSFASGKLAAASALASPSPEPVAVPLTKTSRGSAVNDALRVILKAGMVIC